MRAAGTPDRISAAARDVFISAPHEVQVRVVLRAVWPPHALSSESGLDAVWDVWSNPDVKAASTASGTEGHSHGLLTAPFTGPRGLDPPRLARGQLFRCRVEVECVVVERLLVQG